MMRPPLVLFYLLLTMSGGITASNKPRKSVYFQDMNLKQFKESGFDGLSSLMIRNDIGQLVVGARGKVITLSLDDITKKTSEAKWTVSSADKALCQMKGKDTKETVKSKVHRRTVVQYLIQVQDTNTTVRKLKAAVITLAAFSGLLILLIALVIRQLKAQKQNQTSRTPRRHTGGGGRQ